MGLIENPEVQKVARLNQPVLPEVEGFPLPPLDDLIGEEGPLDQLVGPEEEDDLQIDQLVGLGEEGFPNLPNGGPQLPLNPAENELMALADGLHEVQMPDLNNNDINMPIQNIGGQADSPPP